jgi:hypothetical protein
MKILVMLLFTLSLMPLQSAFAFSCDEMRKDVLALEYKIQKSSLAVCNDASSGEICCRKSDPQSCKTKQELEKDYNEAMAKLIIAEGLASIGMSIESNHNALNDLTEPDITKAKTYLRDLSSSLNSANLIHLALEFEGNTTLFSDYNGNTPQEMAIHLKDKCKSGYFSKMKICSELGSLSKSSPSEHEKFMTTISGFLNSDKRVTNSDSERRPRYEGYQNRLRIEVGGKNLTPAGFKSDPHYQKIMLLESKLTILSERKRLKKPTADIAKEILDLAKVVDDISVNYKNAATETPEVTNYIKKNFDNVLNQLDLPSLILEGGIKDNFVNTSKKLKNEIKRHEGTINQEINKWFENKGSKKLNGNPISSICSQKYDISCLKKLCGETSTNKPDKCENLQELGLDKQYQKLKSYNEHKHAGSILDQAKSCMEKQVSLIEKRNCLTKIQRGSETNISTLRKDLKNAQKGIHYVNSAQPFKGLNLQKGMALNALNSNHCRRKQDRVKYKGVKTDCGQDNILDIDYEALNLGLSGEQVMISLNTQSIKRFLDGAAPKSDIKSYRKELVSACKKGNVNMPNICGFYEDKISWEKKIADEREARKNEIIIDDDYEVPGETLDYSAAWKVAGGVFAQSAMPLTMAWIETDQVKTQSKYQINSINAYNETYMANLEAYREYMENPYQLPYYATNTGYINTGFTYGAYSSFQAASSYTSLLYSNNSGMNFNFNPIPTTNIGVPTSTINTNTTNSTNNLFEFKF